MLSEWWSCSIATRVVDRLDRCGQGEFYTMVQTNPRQMLLSSAGTICGRSRADVESCVSDIVILTPSSQPAGQWS